MLYRSLRALVSFALRLFYRIRVNDRGLPEGGPVMLVGNHPNALIDPALICICMPRPLTFLAKAPLFKLPVLGALMRGIHALPVYRRQDDPDKMGQNEGTLEAAAQGLRQGGVVLIFPEGRSHSEPALGELRTGAARILFRAAKGGADPVLVPVGLTYAEKNRFRSEVHVEVGAPVSVGDLVPEFPDEEHGQVRRLTQRIAEGLQRVTLNLQDWEDLPLLETAEAFYALRRGEPLQDAERKRRFARGLALLRAEQPETVETLRRDAASLKRRLDLVQAAPAHLSLLYRRPQLARFVLSQSLWLVLGLPIFCAGMVLFSVPFLTIRGLAALAKEDLDMQATIKLMATAVIAPLWLGLLVALAWHFAGVGAALGMSLGALPLALFTRYFLERWEVTAHDVRVFFTLGNRVSLKARLLAEGETLARRVEDVAEQLRPRLDELESVAGPRASS